MVQDMGPLFLDPETGLQALQTLLLLFFFLLWDQYMTNVAIEHE